MSISSLIDKISRRSQERETQRLVGFLELVRSIADGKEIEADEAAVILDENGKGTADLEAAVATYQQRVVWSEQYARLGQFEADLVKLRDEKQTEVDHFSAEREKHQRMLQQFAANERDLLNQMNAAQSAADNLRSSVLDETIEPRKEALKLRRKSVVPRLDATENRIHDICTKRDTAAARIEELRTEVSRRKRSESEVSGELTKLECIRRDADGQIASFQERQAELQQQLAAIENEEAELQTAVLVP